MYKINEYVIYGMQGACRIKDITEVDFGEKGKLYYKLVPESDKGGEIYVGVQNGEKKMRRPITKEAASQMLQEMGKAKGKWILDERERERVSKEAIFHGDYEEIIEILTGLIKRRKKRIQQGKRQTELDDRILRNMKKVLLGELAVVLEREMDSLEKEIFKQMDE